MGFPSTIGAPDTTMTGTTLLAVDDHSLNHRVAGSEIIAIENKLGVNAGSAANNQLLFGVGSGSTTWGTVWTSGSLVNPNISGGSLTGTLANGFYGTSTLIGGTANNLTLGTPIIGTISVPGTVNALSFGAAIAPDVGTIVDSAGGTYTVNAQAGQIYYSVMGTAAGNRTIGTPANPTAYQQLTYAFKTSGSANGTLIWTAIHRFSQNIGTPTLGTGVGWNYFGWRYNAIDTKWDYIGQSLNLI